MNRGEFIKNLGMRSAAMMSFYCMGGLTACSSESPQPTAPGSKPGTGGGTGTDFTGNASIGGTKVDFTMDLNKEANKNLQTEGGFAYAGSIIVAKVKGGKFVALTRACTHQGTDVEYRLGQDDFRCPNHGSEFGTTGSVQVGPAASALRVFQTEFNATTSILRVSE